RPRDRRGAADRARGPRARGDQRGLRRRAPRRSSRARDALPGRPRARDPARLRDPRLAGSSRPSPPRARTRAARAARPAGARWAAEIGHDELPALLAADNVRAPVALRANGLRTDTETLRAELADAGVESTPGRWAPTAILVERGAARLRGLPVWRDGRLAYQG